MNDEFLHRIRIEPPPRFVAALKARLDRQPDVHQKWRTWIRNLAMSALVGGTGLAAAVIVMTALRHATTSTHSLAHSSRPIAGGGYNAGRGSSHPASDDNFAAPSISTQSSAPSDANPSPAAANSVRHAPASAAAMALEGMRILGPSSLSPSLKEATRILNLSRPFSEPAFSISGSDSAIAALCNSSHASDHPMGAVGGSADAVGATRRISSEELKRCDSNGIRHVAEIKLGYEAVVVARSQLYPAPKLTARDLFLALARQIPDPEQPQRLIANPNISWNQVDPALADERIDISGPALDSDTAAAFRELFMEPGCSTIASLASLKEKDRARYDEVCNRIRTDGIYHGMDSYLFGQLDAHPETLAVVDFRYFAANAAHLIGAPIEGVEPTAASVYDGSYPGSRALYLYANVARTLGLPRMRDFIYALQDSVAGGSARTSLFGGSESDRRDSRQAALTLPDVKL
jgi:phosphate transport system substrate-binding protein